MTDTTSTTHDARPILERARASMPGLAEIEAALSGIEAALSRIDRDGRPEWTPVDAVLPDALTGRPIPDDLGERVLAVRKANEATGVHVQALTRLRERLHVHQRDTQVRHADPALGVLSTELHQLLTQARPVLAELGDVDSADAAIKAGRVDEWRQAGDLGARYTQLRAAQLELAEDALNPDNRADRDVALLVTRPRPRQGRGPARRCCRHRHPTAPRRPTAHDHARRAGRRHPAVEHLSRARRPALRLPPRRRAVGAGHRRADRRAGRVSGPEARRGACRRRAARRRRGAVDVRDHGLPAPINPQRPAHAPRRRRPQCRPNPGRRTTRHPPQRRKEHRRMSTDYDRVKAAADSGDRRAQRALQDLAQAAAAADEAALPAGERGRAEARRRYGPLPGDAA